MKTPSFLNGAALAFALSIAAAALFATLTMVIMPGVVMHWLIAGLGLAYTLYLLRQTVARVGRVTTVAVWCIGTVATWVFSPSLAMTLIIHVGMVWIIRVLYFSSGALPALLDLGLSALALAAGVWAAGQTGSVLLAVWSFFLVQALFGSLPRSLTKPALTRRVQESTERGMRLESDEDSFERAHRNAEAAVRRLSARS